MGHWGTYPPSTFNNVILGDRLATIDMGRKVGASVPPFEGGGQLGPHVTQCRLGRGLPPYQLNGILIHPADWSQQTWAENWGL